MNSRLLSSTRILLEKDFSSQRAQLFSYYVQHRAIYRLALKAYELMPLRPLFHALFLVRALLLSMKLPEIKASGIHLIYETAIEEAALNVFRSKIGGSCPEPEPMVSRLRWKSPTLGKRAPIFRVLRVLSKVGRRHGVLAPYRLSELLVGAAILNNPRSRAHLILSSAASPLTLALWASHPHARFTYVEHGFPFGGIRHRIPFQDVVLWGPRSLEAYQLKENASVYFGGVPMEATRQFSLQAPYRVGILAPKSVKADALVTLARDLKTRGDVRSILVKDHPNGISLRSSPELRKLGVRFFSGRTIGEFLERVDVALGGNSSSHLEALKQGVPSFFLQGLDHVQDDHCGFVRCGLVQKIDTREPWEPLLTRYQSVHWRELFRTFDDSNLSEFPLG